MDGRPATRRRVASTAFVVAVHVAVGLAIVTARPSGPRITEPDPIPVALVTLPPPEPDPPPAKPEPKSEAPKKAPPPRLHVRAPKPAPPTVAPLVAATGPPVAANAEVSDSEIAGAATAGSGSGSGAGCNLVRDLEKALRKDPLVQSAVARAHRGKALRVWNGNWVRHGLEDGGGLAGVREAIQWEVGFAPQACKNERVKGPVVLSLNDAPGSARLVLGSGAWKWSDLLFARR